MNVRTLCLSILFDEDATGYEIRRMSVEGECSYFVEASFGSIYPALAKLEAEGLVSSRIEPQDGKPAKKVYSITEAGRRAFLDALAEPLGDEVFRSPFLLFARYAHVLPKELVEARLREQLERIQNKIKTLEDLRGEYTSNASDAWVIDFGLACIGAAEKQLKTKSGDLVAISGQSSSFKDAAE